MFFVFNIVAAMVVDFNKALIRVPHLNRLTKLSACGLFKGLIMDWCVLLTSTPECVVSPRRAIPRAQPEGSPRGETTHEGVDVNNTHQSMINPDYNMIRTFIPPKNN